MREVHVEPRFESIVHLHLVRNLSKSLPHARPLILGIHGRPGEGKTFQLHHLLDRAKVHTVKISGGQLESKDAGEPGALIRQSYREAGAYIANGFPAALVLNDADAAIGSWGQLTQYTVNLQIVITELMHLCDFPEVVEKMPTPRVPIFLTGNDFTRIYEPLRRDGRMQLFRWELLFAERVAVMRTLFPAVREAEIERLVRDYPTFSTATWSSVASSIRDKKLVLLAKGSDPAELLRRLALGAIIDVPDEPITLKQIVATAAEIEKHRAADHLTAQAF